MLSYAFDILFLVVVAVSAGVLVRRPVLDSATIWLAFLLSGLITLNCFESVTDFVIRKMFFETDLWLTCFFWFAGALVIFAWLSTMIIIGFQKTLSDSALELGRLDGLGRWTFSLLSGYTLAAFLLVVAHTYPASRDFGGALPPELHRRTTPILSFAPDYQFLTLAEYICNPRSALAGYPWKSRGPLLEASLEQNRWSSFPVRYALWREANQRLRMGYSDDEIDAETTEMLEDPEYGDPEYDEGSSGDGKSVVDLLEAEQVDGAESAKDQEPDDQEPGDNAAERNQTQVVDSV